MNIALGGAQFGMPYGIANKHGMLAGSRLEALLRYASSQGLNYIDTAIGYGESESNLGSYDLSNWQVISKLPNPPATCENVHQWSIEQIQSSLSRLSVDSLAGLLVHDVNCLLTCNGEQIWQAMHNAKHQGITDSIGYSVYHPRQLEQLMEHYVPDLVQLPCNLFDQRFIHSGWIQRLNEAGVKVFARSLLLQGLLVLPATSRNDYFNPWQSHFDDWSMWLNDQNIGPLQACKSFAESVPGIHAWVMGYDDQQQLQQFLECPSLDLKEQEKMAIADEKLINPANWRLV